MLFEMADLYPLWHPCHKERVLGSWLGWHELLSVVEERCYPWNSEDRRGWIPERLDGGRGDVSRAARWLA